MLCCRLVVMNNKYPHLVLQEAPVKIKIPVHKLIAYLTQGPPSLIGSSSSSNQQITTEQQQCLLLGMVDQAEEGEQQQQQQEQQEQQQQVAVVVCHRDQPSLEGSRLQWTGNVETTTTDVPQPTVCLSKMCSNPKHLFYSTQSANAMTGRHHKVQQQKASRQFCGGSCPPGCVKCDRLSKSHKKQKQ